MNTSLDNTPNSSLRFVVLSLIVVATTCFRFFSPFVFALPFNLSPLNAIALFSGVYFTNRFQAFLVPLFSVWLSDLLLNYLYLGHFELFYQGFFWQYGSYILMVGLGNQLKNNVKPLTIAMSSVGASVLFFVITNFGTWYSFNMYPKTLSGLATCFAMGIPFFNATLLGDLCFNALLFGTVYFAGRKYPVLA